MHRIRKGLDLPVSGVPEQTVYDGPRITRVAILADDYPGAKPHMRVAEGETVKRGQPLLEDRASPGVLHTAPAAGRVIGIHRGPRRALLSVVIDLSDGECAGRPDEAELARFDSHSTGDPDRDQVRALLVASGLWTALRMRPFSRVPSPETTPAAIFVTAIDTHPLAPAPQVVLRGQEQDFERGLRLVAKLTQGPTYLCVHLESGIGEAVDAPVRVERFCGPHPAGTVGLHIHLLEPVGRHRTVWHLGYQDVAAIGRLFATGVLDPGRIVSIAGPPVRRPRLVRTRLGAGLDDLTRGELEDGEIRLISGSVLSGKRAAGDVFGYLGRYDVQVSCLREGRERQFLGWAGPGRRVFSVLPLFAGRWLRSTRFDFTTGTRGSPRAMMPIGLYEKVMPLDLLPTFLLRALEVGDIAEAEKLGALELDEEDLALCTFVDPGKQDYGLLLRRSLERIEREG